MPETTTNSTQNEAHALVENAYALIGETLEQDEITQDDIEACQAALQRAKEHDDADIWVTLVTAAEVNTLEHQRYPDGRYDYDSGITNREALERVHEPNNIPIEAT